MKALTITQPWASLIAIGAKRFETRSWSTNYRGPIAIHAAKGLGSVGGASGLLTLCQQEPFRSTFLEHCEELRSLYPHAKPPTWRDMLPLGAIVAVVELTDVVRTETLTALPFWEGRNDHERAFGDYTPGRFAWHLENVWKLADPIVCSGALGLWKAPDALEAAAALTAQYDHATLPAALLGYEDDEQQPHEVTRAA